MVVGKKGRAIERKLRKGFNIELVEGIFNEVLTETKKPKNIFGNLAKAFGKRGKTDWNAKVFQASIKIKDQIGSSQTSLNRSQASLKRRVGENEALLNSMHPDKIAEYNPNLEDYTPQTRIAYAKFKVNTLKMEKEKNKRTEKEREIKEKANIANEMLNQEKDVKREYRTPTPQRGYRKEETNNDKTSGRQKEEIGSKSQENNQNLKPSDQPKPNQTTISSFEQKSPVSVDSSKKSSSKANQDSLDNSKLSPEYHSPREEPSNVLAANLKRSTTPTGKSKISGQIRTGWL